MRSLRHRQARGGPRGTVDGGHHARMVARDRAACASGPRAGVADPHGRFRTRGSGTRLATAQRSPCAGTSAPTTGVRTAPTRSPRRLCSTTALLRTVRRRSWSRFLRRTTSRSWAPPSTRSRCPNPEKRDHPTSARSSRTSATCRRLGRSAQDEGVAGSSSDAVPMRERAVLHGRQHPGLWRSSPIWQRRTAAVRHGSATTRSPSRVRRARCVGSARGRLSGRTGRW